MLVMTRSKLLFIFDNNLQLYIFRAPVGPDRSHAIRTVRTSSHAEFSTFTLIHAAVKLVLKHQSSGLY
jgi:hypothetical protein